MRLKRGEMNCKFKDIAVNEEVLISLNTMYCCACNHQDSYEGKAIYRGHGELDGIPYDVFTIFDFSCPGCGKKIDNYIEPCKGEFYVMKLPVTVEIEKYKKYFDEENRMRKFIMKLRIKDCSKVFLEGFDPGVIVTQEVHFPGATQESDKQWPFINSLLTHRAEFIDRYITVDLEEIE
jgi:ferredoxin-fold anticodon binding domain-containing protein